MYGRHPSTRLRVGLMGLWLAAGLLLTGAFAAETPSAAQREFRLPDTSYYTHGRFVYEANCMICHGPRGRGDGPMVMEDWPDKPRNFTTAVYKYKSTPGDKLPTDADLERTIRHGIANTNMPIFSQLREDELRAVIEYLKFMSRAWRNPDNYADPISIPETPDWFDDPAALINHQVAGRQLYMQSCLPCHGEEADGRGPASTALVNAKGESIYPADLRTRLKSGRTPSDTWRTIAVGINGTPMVGYKDLLTAENIWDLVAYIHSLYATVEKPRLLTRSKAPPAPAEITPGPTGDIRPSAYLVATWN